MALHLHRIFFSPDPGTSENSYQNEKGYFQNENGSIKIADSPSITTGIIVAKSFRCLNPKPFHFDKYLVKMG
jgi:hypothetical protein